MRLIGKFSFLLTFVLVAFVAYDLSTFAARLWPASPKVEDLPSVDLIVVLTGGQGRLREALSLLQNQKGKELLISGTFAQSTIDDILSANEISDFPEAYKSRIRLDPGSQRTVENVQEIRRVIERDQFQSVLVVTSNYHMKRTLWLLEEELARKPAIKVDLIPYPVSSPNFEVVSWWKSLAGWQILFSEYFKTILIRLT
jgi:uncharacterized SAM-binding protein YcdF (DUF218 family)